MRVACCWNYTRLAVTRGKIYGPKGKPIGGNGLFARLIIPVLLLSWPAMGAADSRPECTTDSTPAMIISSAPCGTYGIVTTRKKEVEGIEVDVRVQYMVHAPHDQSPTAFVVLFTGGNGNTGITGDPTTGEVTAAGTNFLVRSAQLFAERKFKTVTIDRPLLALPDPPPVLVPEFSTNAEFDRYRVSPKHKHDIMKVLAKVNEKGLHAFLVGTSRGTISAFAQDKLAEGIVLSSPVTTPSGANLFIRHPDYRNLEVDSVKVPVHVLVHSGDICSVTLPQNADDLHEALLNAGVTSSFTSLAGGFNDPTADACDSLTHHGFLGIENAAVGDIADWIEEMLATLKH
ncbi:MAG: hypothetical protein HYV01_14055 [Deltaproteobacteria bacterium]|nr:hypothetical protein [Deltaproteobacteria bacterium]